MDTKARLLADRIAATNKRVDAKMEAVGKRLDAIDKREPEVFGRVDQWIDSKNSDVGAIEDTLNKLSNISFEQDSSSGK